MPITGECDIGDISGEFDAFKVIYLNYCESASAVKGLL